MLALVASVGEHVGFGGRMDRPGEGAPANAKDSVERNQSKDINMHAATLTFCVLKQGEPFFF